MEIKKITPEMREALKSPLPAEAISRHPTKTFLSAIKAIYVEERLNTVFGIGAWRTRVEYITHEDTKPDKNGFIAKMVVIKLIFEILEYGVYHECYGGNDNADLGDAYKGATTDAITKVGSYLEIGIDVFKGKQQGSGNSSTQATYSPQTTNNAQSTTTPQNNADDDNKPWMTDAIFNVCSQSFKKEDDPNDLMKRLRVKYKVARKYQSMIEDKLMDMFG